MSVELLLALNASCEACAALGPPPSAILTLPPPPLPAFLKVGDAAVAEGDAAPCELQSLQGLQGMGGLSQACDWGGAAGAAPGVKYVELPRQVGGMGVGGDDDTWFLVLVSCCVGVLVLGAVLAIVLMRCRQGSKCVLSLDPSALDGHKSSKLVGGEVLYPDPRALWAALTPSGGTQHFVGPAAQPMAQPMAQPVALPVALPVPHLQLTQRHLTAPSPPPQQPAPTPTAEPEYALPAMPMTAGPPPLEPPPPPPVRVAAFSPPMATPMAAMATPMAAMATPMAAMATPMAAMATPMAAMATPMAAMATGRHHPKHPRQHGHINKMATLSHASYAATLAQSLAADTSSFDNSGFVDSDDQLLAAHDHDAYAALGQGLGYYHTVGGSRRGAHLAVLRPQVSSPTRIANPNLPPLNLHPTATATTSNQSRRSLRRANREAREARHAERHGLGHGDRHHHASSGALAL